MKTFSYYVTYHVEDSGEIEAESYEDAQEIIEKQMYVASANHGYSLGWDHVEFHDLEEIADDGEDDDD